MKAKFNINKRNIMENDSMKLFTMLSGYFILVLVIFSILQIFNCINLNVIQIVSVIVPIIVYLLKNDKIILKRKIVIIVIYLFLLLILPFIYNKTYDLTVDGNSYHKSAIAFIKNGWNPLYETARKFQKNNDNVVPIDDNSRLDLWMEHYPKATWIISATIYNMTGNIESGKCITFILTLMLFIISYNCLRKIIDKKWSLVVSIFLILNPIILSQFFSYYVDGIMGICFVIELLVLMQINPAEKMNWQTFIILVAICSIFVNLKFTGLLCSGVIAAVYYFYWLIINRKKNFIKTFKRLTIFFTLIYVVAIFLVGANSYIKNTIDHHNPLYPLIGKDKVDIITTMQPKSFKNKNALEKFIISYLSKTENVSYGGEPSYKIPFFIYKKEISTLYDPDVRMAGFGPLTTVIFVLAGVLFIIFALLLYNKEKRNLKYIVLPLLAVILTIILVGESWWARYIPQFYLIPIGVIFLAVYLKKYYKKIMIPTALLILAITINTGCFLYINAKEIIGFRAISSDIKLMKKVDDLKLKVMTAPDLYGFYYTLSDNGVKYSIDNNIDSKDILYKYSWRIGVEAREELY